MKNIFKLKIPVWVLIPVFTIFILLMYFIYLTVTGFFDDVFNARQEVENYENILNSSSISAEVTPVPEKTASELEAVYEKNHNPDTLRLIISKYEAEENPDYEKIFKYYEKYFETAEEKDIEESKRSYVTSLYESGQKEKYYEITNVLLNDKNYMSEVLAIGEPVERPMINTVLLMNPIVNSSTSTIEDYNYAISKLIAFDIDNAEYLKEFERQYLLYSTLSRLYYKTNNIKESNIYKDKIINELDKFFADKSDIKDMKDNLIENLNQSIMS
jgi:hypothetical protein